MADQKEGNIRARLRPGRVDKIDLILKILKISKNFWMSGTEDLKKAKERGSIKEIKKKARRSFYKKYRDLVDPEDWKKFTDLYKLIVDSYVRAVLGIEGEELGTDRLKFDEIITYKVIGNLAVKIFFNKASRTPELNEAIKDFEKNINMPEYIAVLKDLTNIVPIESPQFQNNADMIGLRERIKMAMDEKLKKTIKDFREGILNEEEIFENPTVVQLNEARQLNEVFNMVQTREMTKKTAIKMEKFKIELDDFLRKQILNKHGTKKIEKIVNKFMGEGVKLAIGDNQNVDIPKWREILTAMYGATRAQKLISSSLFVAGFLALGTESGRDMIGSGLQYLVNWFSGPEQPRLKGFKNMKALVEVVEKEVKQKIPIQLGGGPPPDDPPPPIGGGGGDGDDNEPADEPGNRSRFLDILKKVLIKGLMGGGVASVSEIIKTITGIDVGIVRWFTNKLSKIQLGEFNGLDLLDNFMKDFRDSKTSKEKLELLKNLQNENHRKNYNFLGPGTNVYEKLLGDVSDMDLKLGLKNIPINNIDFLALRHDLLYNGDPLVHRKSDEELITGLNKIFMETGSIDALIATIAMNGKNILEDISGNIIGSDYQIIPAMSGEASKSGTTNYQKHSSAVDTLVSDYRDSLNLMGVKYTGAERWTTTGIIDEERAKELFQFNKNKINQIKNNEKTFSDIHDDVILIDGSGNGEYPKEKDFIDINPTDFEDSSDRGQVIITAPTKGFNESDFGLIGNNSNIISQPDNITNTDMPKKGEKKYTKAFLRWYKKQNNGSGTGVQKAFNIFNVEQQKRHDAATSPVDGKLTGDNSTIADPKLSTNNDGPFAFKSMMNFPKAIKTKKTSEKSNIPDAEPISFDFPMNSSATSPAPISALQQSGGTGKGGTGKGGTGKGGTGDVGISPKTPIAEPEPVEPAVELKTDGKGPAFTVKPVDANKIDTTPAPRATVDEDDGQNIEGAFDADLQNPGAKELVDELVPNAEEKEKIIVNSVLFDFVPKQLWKSDANTFNSDVKNRNNLMSEPPMVSSTLPVQFRTNQQVPRARPSAKVREKLTGKFYNIKRNNKMFVSTDPYLNYNLNLIRGAGGLQSNAQFNRSTLYNEDLRGGDDLRMPVLTRQ